MSRPRPPITSMEDRTVVITGANSGIGLETAAALAGAGARIVMGCRNATTAAAAVDEVRRRSGNDAVETHSLDLSDLDHVRRFADELSTLDRIDVLINNAGLMLDRRQESAQGYEGTFATNHLGPVPADLAAHRTGRGSSPRPHRQRRVPRPPPRATRDRLGRHRPARQLLRLDRVRAVEAREHPPRP